jgi:gamma-glutamylcyclotransferase (GGCT)/AIG2-like uncharacterized protein YtfP
LEGFTCFRIRNADYPEIFPREGCRVDGTLFSGITESEWERLDYYESDFYERRQVNVRLANGKSARAFAYVLPPENESMCLKESWDLNRYHPTNH